MLCEYYGCLPSALYREPDYAGLVRRMALGKMLGSGKKAGGGTD